jgi:putative protease
MEEIGKVIGYFKIPQAAVIKIEKGTLTVGDHIKIKGHTTDFTQKVESMQIEHKPVNEVSAPQEIGLKVKEKVRDHDIVYKLDPSEIEET